MCEFPAALKPLTVDLISNHLVPDAAGQITAPDAPGLGMSINTAALRQYQVEAEIRVGGRTLYSSSALAP